MGGKVTKVLVDLKRMVSYICPFCSNISSKSMSVFDFSGGDKIKLTCPTHGCHETCVTITKKSDRYSFTIECPLCGEKHSYQTTRENFWNKRIIAYKCPAAGIDIFLAGERREVEKILEDNSDIYSDIIDGYEEDLEIEHAFNIMYEIVDRLQILRDSHRLSCKCGSENIEVNIINGNVLLSCMRCRKTKLLEASEETLTRLLNSHAVILGQ